MRRLRSLERRSGSIPKSPSCWADGILRCCLIKRSRRNLSTSSCAGQGEDAMLEVVQRIEAGESPHGIRGVGYKEDGDLVFNPPRALQPFARCRRRHIISRISTPINVSAGGAGQCTPRVWRVPTTVPIARMQASTAASGTRCEREQVVEEMCDLVARVTGCNCCGSWMTIFWSTRTRAVAIAEGLVPARSAV